MVKGSQENLFLKWITKRAMKENLNVTAIIEGEYTGIGKSYMAMYLSEQYHKEHKKKLPPFTVDNVFFKPEDAMDFIGDAQDTVVEYMTMQVQQQDIGNGSMK